MGHGVQNLLEESGLQPGGYQGEVLSAPADVTERVEVAIDGFDDEPGRRSVFEAAWTPRPVAGGGLELPTEGDACLVVLDDTGDAWLLTWWPYGD